MMNCRRFVVVGIVVMMLVVVVVMLLMFMLWSYFVFDGFCFLQEIVVVDGVLGVYLIGFIVDMKFGKWICIKVVVSQFLLKIGGVWVQKQVSLLRKNLFFR